MKEPTRLLSGGASDFERELLRSWEAEQPSEEERAKVLAMAGVGAGAAAVLAKAGSSLAPKAGVTGVALAKWLLLGVVGPPPSRRRSFVYVDRARRGPEARLAGRRRARVTVPERSAHRLDSPAGRTAVRRTAVVARRRSRRASPRRPGLAGASPVAAAARGERDGRAFERRRSRRASLRARPRAADVGERRSSGRAASAR